MRSSKDSVISNQTPHSESGFYDFLKMRVVDSDVTEQKQQQKTTMARKILFAEKKEPTKPQ